MDNVRYDLEKLPLIYENNNSEQELNNEYSLIIHTILNSLVNDIKKFSVYFYSSRNEAFPRIVYEVPNNLYIDEILNEAKYFKFCQNKKPIPLVLDNYTKVYRKISTYHINSNNDDWYKKNSRLYTPILPFTDEKEDANYALPFVLTLSNDGRSDKWHSILYLLNIVKEMCIKISITSKKMLLDYIPYINKCMIKLRDNYEIIDNNQLSDLYRNILFSKTIFHTDIEIFSNNIVKNNQVYQAILGDWGCNTFTNKNNILDITYEPIKDILMEVQASFTIDELTEFLKLPYFRNNMLGYYESFIPKPFNIPQINETNEVEITEDISDNFIELGKLSNNKLLAINPQILIQHLFICGTTGSAKTTLVKWILKKLPSDIHFVIIDPIKDDYGLSDEFFVKEKSIHVIDFFGNSFKMNPFSVPYGVNIHTHASLIARVLSTIIPMSQSGFDYFLGIVKETYKRKVGAAYNEAMLDNKFIAVFYDKHPEFVPEFNDLFNYGYGWLHEILKPANDSKSATVADREANRYFEKWEERIKVSHPLIYNVFNSNENLELKQMIDSQNIVINLREFSDPNEKKAMMLFFIGMINEFRRAQGVSEQLKHVMVLEEAHLIMPANAKGSYDNMVSGADYEICILISNLLAEIRAFGEGIIISEQSPSKIIADTLINTSTKIIKRLTYGYDIDYLAEAIGLEENERKYLLTLTKSESIVYLSGTSRPMLVYCDYRK